MQEQALACGQQPAVDTFRGPARPVELFEIQREDIDRSTGRNQPCQKDQASQRSPKLLQRLQAGKTPVER